MFRSFLAATFAMVETRAAVSVSCTESTVVASIGNHSLENATVVLVEDLGSCGYDHALVRYEPGSIEVVLYGVSVAEREGFTCTTVATSSSECSPPGRIFRPPDEALATGFAPSTVAVESVGLRLYPDCCWTGGLGVTALSYDGRLVGHGVRVNLSALAATVLALPLPRTPTFEFVPVEAFASGANASFGLRLAPAADTDDRDRRRTSARLLVCVVLLLLVALAFAVTATLRQRATFTGVAPNSPRGCSVALSEVIVSQVYRDKAAAPALPQHPTPQQQPPWRRKPEVDPQCNHV
mmetsp:Transcript_16612/g.51966  ORF Transcript_16612/g.51966 Transcript_16612/m.51966 type:complete len:295 (+) Transcript_16612:127-1011(+)